MTRFLDLRIADVGGELAKSVAITQRADNGSYTGLDKNQFLQDIQGRNVLLATHGFNVNRANGLSSLSNWSSKLQFDAQSVFVGVLWPGDSIWLHGLDYPEEPRVADDAGKLLAPFIDANFGGAASISFASHSLGARVLLETISQMNRPVRRATIMAGAIDDDCLNTEFQAAVAKIGKLSILASHEDEVLSLAFPAGNFLAGILTAGHPWWHSALGRTGPVDPMPSNFQAPYEIPDNWSFGHGDYLLVDPPIALPLPLQTDVPPNGTPEPAGGAPGWESSWSAALVSTRFR
jgi:hypothetical protein